jgi:hypothetical protein
MISSNKERWRGDLPWEVIGGCKIKLDGLDASNDDHQTFWVSNDQLQYNSTDEAQKTIFVKRVP